MKQFQSSMSGSIFNERSARRDKETSHTERKYKMIKYYVNEKEVDRKEFEKEFGFGDVDWRIETMALNRIKEYEKKGPYNRICKIAII